MGKNICVVVLKESHPTNLLEGEFYEVRPIISPIVTVFYALRVHLILQAKPIIIDYPQSFPPPSIFTEVQGEKMKDYQ